MTRASQFKPWNVRRPERKSFQDHTTAQSMATNIDPGFDDTENFTQHMVDSLRDRGKL